MDEYYYAPVAAFIFPDGDERPNEVSGILGPTGLRQWVLATYDNDLSHTSDYYHPTKSMQKLASLFALMLQKRMEDI